MTPKPSTIEISWKMVNPLEVQLYWHEPTPHSLHPCCVISHLLDTCQCSVDSGLLLRY